MNRKGFFLQFALLASTLLTVHAAVANPVPCPPGYPNSTCAAPITYAPVPAPKCPQGQVQTISPYWMGSGWTGLSCVALAPAPSLTPAPPAGSSMPTAPDGYPYAAVVAYCGLALNAVTHTDIGDRQTWYCTHSLAGATRQSGVVEGDHIDTPTYWHTPDSSQFNGFQNTSIRGIVMAYLSAGYIVPEGYVFPPMQGVEYVNRGGGEEDWVFVCPVSYPQINTSTFDAYQATDPALIECAPLTLPTRTR
jgi:hypothetical protein